MAVQFKNPNNSTLRIKIAMYDGVIADIDDTPDSQKQFSFKGINPLVQTEDFQTFLSQYLGNIFQVRYDSANSSLSVIKPFDLEA